MQQVIMAIAKPIHFAYSFTENELSKNSKTDLAGLGYFTSIHMNICVAV